MTRLRVLRKGFALLPVVLGFLAGICVTMLGTLNTGLETDGNSNTANMQMKQDEYSSDDTSVAERLYKDVRILCWVMTHKDNWYTRAIYIQRTWGRRCTKLLFFSSETSHSSLPVIGLGTGEGRHMLDNKTKLAFRYVYDHYFNDFDWFLRADDDTYVIMENLRHFLWNQDPTEAVYFGKLFKCRVKGGSFSGGAGIVLGKEALRRFAETGWRVRSCRPQSSFADDLWLGLCLQALGVVAGHTPDESGRSRFHCLDWRSHITGKFPDWYYEQDADGAKWGIESISEHAISFHYMKPEEMYLFDLFLYHIRPYGLP